MKVYPVENINNKNSNYYKVEKYGQGFSVHVMTKNTEKLGKKPILETRFGNAEMVYDGKFYISKITPSNKYKIKYEDTGLYENNGEEKSFDYSILNDCLKQENPIKTVVLSEGSAKGKLVYAKDLNKDSLNDKTPLVVICENEEECFKCFAHADGMIVTSAPAEFLSHFASMCRDYFSFGSLITDEILLDNLKTYIGKYISITNENKILGYQEIEPLSKTPEILEPITIPKLRRIDKILTLEECEKDTVGNKAYNLKRLSGMIQKGIIKDIKIPNAFILPYGYLEKVEKLIDSNREHRWSKNEILNEIMEFSDNVLKENLMLARSAFNGEDIDGYSAAGLYDSTKFNSKAAFRLGLIYDVMNSKYNPQAIKSRKRHGISDDEIKPSVIIQDYISTDYSFTLYTESPFNSDNKVIIELFENENRQMKPNPYQLVYDRDTEKLSIEKEHSLMTEYIFDEDYNLIDKKVTGKHKIKEIWAELENLVKNALIIEKGFGKPQDIEGGIKDKQVYLWQTRNIVKKIRP